MRHKCAWGMKQILLSAIAEVRFRHQGQEIYLPAGVKYFAPEKVVVGDMVFEGVGNRDSLPYINTYRMQHHLQSLQTFMRGTLRWPGFSTMVRAFIALNLTEDDPFPEGVQSWKDYIAQVSQQMTTDPNNPGNSDDECIRASLFNYFTIVFTNQSLQMPINYSTATEANSVDLAEEAIEGLVQLGFFRTDSFISSEKRASRLEALSDLLQQQCRYFPDRNEHDMVVLLHEIVAQMPNESWRQGLIKRRLCLKQIGTEKESAVARMISVSMVIAARLLLKGTLRHRGVIKPTSPEIYEPILAELQGMGIVFEETTQHLA